MEFDMPFPSDEYESIIYFRIKEALEEAAIPYNKSFTLNILEGDIFKTVKTKTRLNEFNKRFGIGCAATPPSIKYSNENNENKISYIRELYLDIERNKFFVNGIADMLKIAEALSNQNNYFETLSVYAKDIKIPITIFSDRNGWFLRVRDREAVGNKLEKKDIYLKDAVNLALDFFQPQNI